MSFPVRSISPSSVSGITPTIHLPAITIPLPSSASSTIFVSEKASEPIFSTVDGTNASGLSGLFSTLTEPLNAPSPIVLRPSWK